MKVMAKRIVQKIFVLFFALVMALGICNVHTFGAKAAGESYTLVTSADDIAAGDKLLIVCPTAKTAMGAISTTSTKYGTSVGVTIENNAITLNDANVKIVTLGGTTGAWTFSTDAGYLYWKASNSLNVQADEYTWTIDIATSGSATIKSVATSERILRYNTSSPRFACYTSGQADIALYKFQEPAHEHAYAWNNEVGVDGSHTLACADTDGKCDVLTITEECTWVDGYCSVCGATAPECAHPTTTEAAEVPATCTEVGYTAGVQCTVCNQYISGHEEVDALGHTIQTDEAVDATCTTTGLTAGSHCSVCNEVLTAQEEVPALGHNYVDGVCSVCSEKEPTTLTITQSSFKNVGSYGWYDWTATTTTGASISGSGFTTNNTAAIQVNGSKAGDYIYNTTALPGRIASVTLTKASGTDRNFDVLTSATAFDSSTTASLKGQATAAKKVVTTEGVTWTFETYHKYFAIVICDSSAAYLSSIEITYDDKTCPHVWSNGTCTACGIICSHDYINGTCSICSVVCDHNFVNGACTICNMVCAHTWVSGECTVCGMVCEHNFADGVCTICGDTAPTHECVFEGEGVVTTEPNCTTKGERTWTCAVDGCEQTKTEEIAALGHDVSETQKDPTCTEDGWKTTSCQRKGCDSEDVKKEEVLPATGHTFADGSVTCSVCGEQKKVYVKVTEAPTDWSGSYLIVYEEKGLAFNGSLTELDVANNGVTVSVNDDSEILVDDLSMQFTVAVVDGGYSIQSASGWYIGRDADSNGLLSNETKTYVNTFSLNDDGSVNIIGAGGAYLRYNASSGQDRFRYYKTTGYTSQKPIALYKLKTAEEGGSAVTENKVAGHTVTLGDSIGVNFYMSLTAETLADETAYMLFTLPNGDTETVYVKDVKNSAVNEMYKFTAYIAVKEMADTIKAQLITANGNSEEYTYSVKTYATTIIANESSTYTGEEIALAKALLNYGAYAQTMFNYNTDKLANSALEETDKNLETVTVEGAVNTVEGSVTGATYLGTTTVWEADMAIRHYFDITGDNVTFTLNGETLTVVDSDNGKYVAIDGIVAKDMATTYTLTISDGTNQQTISYNAYAYFAAIIGSDNYRVEEKNAMKAAYLYAQAAIAYEESKNQ